MSFTYDEMWPQNEALGVQQSLYTYSSQCLYVDVHWRTVSLFLLNLRLTKQLKSG